MDDTSKNKVICEAPRDHFTALPNDIMSHILERLPLRDAARSMILSKKWMQTWITLSHLRFDAQFFVDVLRNKQYQECEFCNIVGVVLLSHKGPINTFYLYIPTVNGSRKSDVGLWLAFLSRNNVKEIALQNGQKIPLKVSSHLFSCLDLEKLKLDHCCFDLLPSFNGFRNLKSLELENTEFKGNSLKGLISGCPTLESLTLKNCTGCESVYITAPNLKYLTVSGKFESICFRGAPNLLAISIALNEMVKIYHEARRQELIRFLANSSKIEKLFFGGYFCKFLAAGQMKELLQANYKCLKVLEISNIESNDLDEFRCAVGLILSCPLIETLKISFSSKGSADHNFGYDPCFSLAHLREAHITSIMGVTMELLFIEFLLLCSPALEKLYIERSKHINSILESKMTRELMCFPRASPKAKVIYVDPINS